MNNSEQGLGSLGSATGIGTAGGVAAGFLCGLIEGGWVAWSAGPAGLLFALALYVPAGLLVGGALGLVAGGVLEALGGAIAPHWRRLSGDRDLDIRVAAALAAIATCVLLEVAIVWLFARGPASAMANPRLAQMSTALVAGGGLVGAIAAFFPLWQLARRAARWLPPLGGLRATAAVLGALALALFATGGWVVTRLDWRVLRVGPWAMVGLLVASAAIVAVLLHKRVPALGWRRAALVIVALAVASPLVALWLGGNQRTVAAAQQRGWLVQRLIAAGRHLSDGDGDGFSAWLSGGDCDDDDPSIHPAARDIPGNGVDENCMGGDSERQPPKAARAVGRRGQLARPKSGSAKLNLLLLCIDTLRADVLGGGKGQGTLTPQIDRLSAQGVIFRRAYAQGANTPQSFPSVFTSRYPSRVPVVKRNVGYPVVKEEALSVFELLQQAGLRTVGISSHFYFSARRGIRQGFDEWDNRGATSLRDSNKDIASPRIVPRAIERFKSLAAEKRPFAMFVHLFEPHSTYVRHGQFSYSKRGVEGLREKYDNEVRFVDQWVGKLLDGLRSAGLMSRTAVVLFSDHGEAFGEHGFYFHGQALYNEVLRVPLLVRAPGVRPRAVERPVALIDIAPTLLDLVGLEIPAGFQGRSLLSFLRPPEEPGAGGDGQGISDPEPSPRRIGAVLLPYPAWPKGQRMMIEGRHKILARTTENRFEIYDLERDPAEQRNLAARDRALAERMKERYARFVEAELQ